MKPNIDNISYQQKEYDPKMKQNKTFLVLGIFLIFAATFGFDWLLRFFNNLPYPQTSGEFGDQFGVLNSLFSGLAFVILIYTLRQQEEQIRLQREDLQNQKEDLKLQREEMQRQCAEQKRQADEFEAQNKLMKIQQFDSFFHNYFTQILKMKNKIDKIKLLNDGVEEKLLYLIYGISNKIFHEKNKLEEKKELINIIKGAIASIRFFGDSLYTIFKYILDDEYLDNEQKIFYLRILSNSLDSTENKSVYFYGIFCNYKNIVSELEKINILYKDSVIEHVLEDNNLNLLRKNMDTNRNIWLQNC
ncbi:hypothetical protein [Akkermansia biwaensis]